MRTVTATRYVTPLREGGSMPGLVEADDDGLYVLKFRGAGQGTLALVPDDWLTGPTRADYVDYLLARVARSAEIAQEAERART
jgi:hypothetical protein